MTLHFTISPDFSPEYIPGWYIFNTWFQRHTGEAIHLEMYDHFSSQRAAIQADKVDMIYANPFDAAMLVREKGFAPLVRAKDVADEAIIAVSVNSAVDDVADLVPGVRVASTDDPDVHLMGMILLEPGDLDGNNIEPLTVDNYILVAKHLLKGDADVGIFLAEAYDGLSTVIKRQLKVLVRSQIGVVHHALMVGPALRERRDELQQLLVSMDQDEKGRGVLASLGYSAWQSVDDEEMEFMIDLMDTLNT